MGDVLEAWQVRHPQHAASRAFAGDPRHAPRGRLCRVTLSCLFDPHMQRVDAAQAPGDGVWCDSSLIHLLLCQATPAHGFLTLAASRLHPLGALHQAKLIRSQHKWHEVSGRKGLHRSNLFAPLNTCSTLNIDPARRYQRFKAVLELQVE